MKSRPSLRACKLWVFFSAAALVVAFGAVVVFALQTDPQEAGALRTWGAVLAVTQGDEPRVLGARWQKWLLRLAPALERHIGGNVLHPNNANAHSLVIWKNLGELYLGTHRGGTIAPLLIGDRGERLRSFASTVNDFYINVPGSHGIPHGVTVVAYVVTTYPRRGAQVRMRFDAHGEPDTCVPNPTPGHYGAWVPGPTRQRAGNLDVTLTRFRTGVTEPYGIRPYPQPETQLDLAIRENGKPAANRWYVEHVLITDPTGNTWSSDDFFPWIGCKAVSDKKMHVRMLPPLIGEEPAYRVRLELARRNVYPAEDLCTFPGLVLPPPGQIARPSRKGKLHGCDLELIQLTGKETKFSSEYGPASRLRFIGPPDRYCFRRFGVGSDYGNDLLQADGDQIWIDLDDVEGGKPFDLRLAVTPRRTVEFLAHASPAPQHAPVRP